MSNYVDALGAKDLNERKRYKHGIEGSKQSPSDVGSEFRISA